MNYINLLKEHNLKVTPQRLLIVESLYKKGHLNIDELYLSLKESFSNISPATIYKNIHIMSENSLIQEVKIPNEKNVYELVKEEHSHIVCIKCHNIIDITLDTDNLIQQASNMTHFKINTNSIVFNGVCPDCVA